MATSWTNASRSISGLPWSSIKGGDTIYVSGGYDSTTYICGGTPVNNFINSQNFSENVVITKGWEASHNGKVKFVQSSNLKGYAFRIDKSSNLKLVNLNFANEITDILQDGEKTIYLNETSHITIDHCIITSNGNGDPLFLNTDNATTINACTLKVYANTFLTSQQDLVHGAYGSDHTFTNNFFIDEGIGGDSGDMIQLAQLNGGGTLTIANNFFFDVASKSNAFSHYIYLSQLKNQSAIVYNNIFVMDVGSGGGTNIFKAYTLNDSYAYTNSVKILNNTIISNNSITGSLCLCGQVDTTIVKNNLVIRTESGTANGMFYLINKYSVTSSLNGFVDIDYNQYYSSSGDAFYVYGSDGVKYWNDWQAMGYDKHSKVSSIKLLKAWGTKITDYMSIEKYPGIDLSNYFDTDILGNIRPEGAWNKGAFQGN